MKAYQKILGIALTTALSVATFSTAANALSGVNGTRVNGFRVNGLNYNGSEVSSMNLKDTQLQRLEVKGGELVAVLSQ